jgi:hypothetical protein
LDYKSGRGKFALGEGINFGVNNQGNIGNVSPGVFFYYNTIATTDSIVIAQDNGASTLPLFGTDDKQVRVFTTACAPVTPGDVDVTDGQVTIGGLAPGTYIVSVKYDPGTVVGEDAPGLPVTYTFTTPDEQGDAATVQLKRKP